MGRERSRGISTVVDVAIALFLITASIGIFMGFLDTSSPDNTPETAERTATTLSGTTMNTTYSMIPIRSQDEFNDKGYDDIAYERQSYGATATEIGRATVVNARFNDTAGSDAGDTELLTKEGVRYAEAVHGETLDTLTGANQNARVTAIWRPYEDAEIEGRQQYGPTPPGDADVSTSTMTVPSSIPKSDRSKIASAYSSSGIDWEAAAQPVAEAIIEGYFPPEEMQLSLEAQRFERSLAVYRYLRMADIVGVDFERDESPLSRTGADATEANEQLAVTGDGNLTSAIAADMEASYDEDEIESSSELADRVSTERVTITVETWNT